MSDDIGDLLAHWTYRATSLWRDIQECERTVKQLKNPPRTQHIMGYEIGGFLEGDLPAVEHELYCLRYLYAEAEYTQLRLDIGTRYTHLVEANEKLDHYLNRASELAAEHAQMQSHPEPLSLDLNDLDAVAKVLAEHRNCELTLDMDHTSVPFVCAASKTIYPTHELHELSIARKVLEEVEDGRR